MIKVPSIGVIVGRARSSDGVEIVYRAKGRGKPALLFIHGGFADWSFWSGQIDPFAARHRVVALDLAGHGESGSDRKEWSMAAFAQDVKVVVEKEKLSKVILVGNSLGGPVAMEAALLLPGRVVGVVAVDTLHQLQRDPADTPEAYHRQAESYRQDYPGTIRQMCKQLFHADADKGLYAWAEERMLRRQSPEMAVSLMESLASFDLENLARKLAVPIRCINGDLYPTQVEKNRLVHPDFDAVVLPHMGHYPMIENPELFNRTLETIVTALSGSR